MALSLRYFNEFGKPAFQLITASSSIELIDQKSASVTHRAVKLVCVTKFTHSQVEWISPLLTCNLSFKFHFTVVMVSSCDAWLNTVWPMSVPEFYAPVYCILCSTCRMSS